MNDVVFNMETADPDDVLTLCFLAGHPKVNLIGVVITPGTYDQVALVNHVCKLLEISIPIGARKPNHPKDCVSAFHYKWLGKNFERVEPTGLGGDVLKTLHDQYNDLKVLSGAPLGNIYDYLNENNNKLDEIVVQGGFAGDNLVAEEDCLEKFKGKTFCPTFNLGGDKTAALYITEDIWYQFHKQYYVSKNCCHGLAYDKNFHEKVKQYKDNNTGLKMVYAGMDIYLKDHPNGKLFHDPLAACVLIDKSVCEFKEVDLIYRKGEWGAVETEQSNKYISVKLNREKFEKVFLGEENV